jgi:hypothetical protein
MSALLGLLFGLLQGFRHAFEPDHVVAVSTMISEQRAARVRVAYAAAWGIGHAAMLVLVGGLLMLLRAELPRRLEALFELAVSMMLIGLGARALRRAAIESKPRDLQATAPESGMAKSWRAIGPLAMGMIHGLAGTGALTALVVARLPSPAVGVAFMVLFGAGATLGMSLLAGAAGVPLRRLLRTRWGMPALLGATGGLSLVLGLTWFVPAMLRLASF